MLKIKLSIILTTNIYWGMLVQYEKEVNNSSSPLKIGGAVISIIKSPKIHRDTVKKKNEIVVRRSGIALQGGTK